MSSFIKLSLVSMLILCVMFQHATAKPLCYRIVCVYKSYGSGYIYVCARIIVLCSSGKRSFLGQNEDSNEVPLPSTFAKYDQDNDGGITLEEMAKMLSVEKSAKETVNAFRRADRNDDGKIDCDEFKEAPYLFAHRPKC